MKSGINEKFYSKAGFFWPKGGGVEGWESNTLCMLKSINLLLVARFTPWKKILVLEILTHIRFSYCKFNVWESLLQYLLYRKTVAVCTFPNLTT